MEAKAVARSAVGAAVVESNSQQSPTSDGEPRKGAGCSPRPVHRLTSLTGPRGGVRNQSPQAPPRGRHEV
jgi:hypothetical protein